MKIAKDSKQVTRIREGIGPNYRQVLVVGESAYRDVRRSDVLFETSQDHIAWDTYAPRTNPEYIDLYTGPRRTRIN